MALPILCVLGHVMACCIAVSQYVCDMAGCETSISLSGRSSSIAVFVISLFVNAGSMPASKMPPERGFSYVQFDSTAWVDKQIAESRAKAKPLPSRERARDGWARCRRLAK